MLIVPNSWVAQARWVVDGNIWSSSGVSAGIDVTLAWVQSVWGYTTAKELADGAEYDWHQDADWVCPTNLQLQFKSSFFLRGCIEVDIFHRILSVSNTTSLMSFLERRLRRLDPKHCYRRHHLRLSLLQPLLQRR